MFWYKRFNQNTNAGQGACFGNVKEIILLRVGVQVLPHNIIKRDIADVPC